MNRTVVLFSGGLDSAVCLKLYGGDDLLALSFDYGQPHSIELKYAKDFAKNEGVPIVIKKVETIYKTNKVFFAGRNAVLISLAISYAQANGYSKVVVGCNQSDAELFSDCRSDFLEHMNEVAKTYGILLEYPLIKLTKKNVVTLAKILDVTNTWTCYEPKNGKPCEICHSCAGLKNAEN